MPDLWYEDFKPATSGGVLPNTVSADAFRFKRGFIWNLTSGGLIPAGGVVTGGFQVDITNEDGSVVFFRTRVKTKLFFVVFGLFYSYNYLGDEFETTIVGGIEVAPGDIGKFLDGGPGDTEQGDLQPAEGGGAFLGEGAVQGDWFSPIWYFTKGGGLPLPPGYKVKISHDYWDLGPKSVEYGWAFEEGSQVHGYIDRHGAIRSVELMGSNAILAHTYFGPKSRLSRGTIAKVSDVYQWKDTSNRMYYLASQENEWRLWYDDLEGLNPQPLLDAGGKQVAYWTGKDWKNITEPKQGKRGVATTAQLGGEQFFMFAKDVKTPGTIQRVGIHNKKPMYVLLKETATGEDTITLTDFDALQYDYDGENWNQVL